MEIFNFDKLDFKIKNLNINIKLYKYKENVCNAICNFNKTNTDNNILNNPAINFEIYYNNIDSDFIEEIESVILHELLHCYQYFNQQSNNKFIPMSWSIGASLIGLRKDIKNNNCKNILDLIYKSLQHEISAQKHQYYFYEKRNKLYPKINNIIKMLEDFNIFKIVDENDDLNLIKKHHL